MISRLKPLHIQVLIAIAAGIILGIVAPGLAIRMKPLGDGFIALLRLLLAPIIFLTVVHGLAGIRDVTSMGRLGLKTLLYCECVSALALLFGFLLASVFKPGIGLHVSAAAPVAIIPTATVGAAPFTAVNFLLGIIPTTIVDAFAKGDILQVLFVSVLVGLALMQTTDSNSVIVAGISEAQRIVFAILNYFMRLAPIGAFGAIAATVGTNGVRALTFLATLVGVFYAGCFVFIVVVFGSVCRIAGISLWQVIRLIRDEVILVFGTASGEVAFPRLVSKLERAGVEEAVVGFVLPAGYSFNLDGTAMYMALSVGFIAQATDSPFALRQQLAVLAVLLFTSKGGTTVAGGAFVKLAATLNSVHMLPVSGLGLLFGVDRLMSTAIAVTNIIGNSVAVLAIARWENKFDAVRFSACILEPEGSRDSDVSAAAVKGHEVSGEGRQSG